MRSQGAAAAVAVAVVAAACAACGDGRRSPAPSASVTTSAATSASGAATASAQPRVPLPASSPAGLTRYPVVLVHGMWGFAQLGPVSYFNRVADRLRAIGCEVLVPQTSPVNTSAHRAAELRDQILAAWPDPAVKVNLICHSQGGLDARCMVSSLGMGDRVASLTTIGTPHRGSAVADLALGLIPGPTQAAIDALLVQLGLDWNQIRDLSMTWARGSFNPANPDDPRVHYQSWAGRADFQGAPGIAELNPVMYASYPLVAVFEGENDGLVSLDSARWGDFRGVIPCDHAGEIGWPWRPGFDHLLFYEELALDLARRGF